MKRCGLDRWYGVEAAWLALGLLCICWSAPAFAGSYGSVQEEWAGMGASMPCDIGAMENGEDAEIWDRCMAAKKEFLALMRPELEAMYAHYADGKHPYSALIGELSKTKIEGVYPATVTFRLTHPKGDPGEWSDSEVTLRLWPKRTLSPAEREKMGFDFLMAQRSNKSPRVRALIDRQVEQFGAPVEALVRNWVAQGPAFSVWNRLCLYVHPRAQTQLEAWAKAEPEGHFGVLARIMSTLPLARSDVERLVQLIAPMDSESRGTAAHRLGLFLPAAQWKHGAQLLRSQAPEVERWLDGFSSLQAASGARAWHTVTRVDDGGRGDVRPGALVKVEEAGVRFVTPQRQVIFQPARWQEPIRRGMTEWGRITVQAEPGKLTISLDDKPLISARTPTAEERGFVREVLAARPSDESLCERAERCCLDAMPLLGVECNLKESLGEPRRVQSCEAFLQGSRNIFQLKEQPLPASCKP